MIRVSAPYRLDIGGTWDLPPLLYFGRQYNPRTITIALSERISVEISDFEPAWVSIMDNSMNNCTMRESEYDFTNKFGLIQAILAFFECDGVTIDVCSNVPSRIGLGGSGALTVALITAVCAYQSKPKMSVAETVRLAHEIESSFFSITGFQDQLAACVGGVQLWEWQYPAEATQPEELLSSDEYKDFEDRLVIAVVGTHDSNEVNKRQINSFLNPWERPHWNEINNCTKGAASAFRFRDWYELTRMIKREHEIRNEIAYKRISGMEKYISATKDTTGAFATAGAGQAVCWYFSPDIDEVVEVRNTWKSLGARIIPNRISKSGLLVNVINE